MTKLATIKKSIIWNFDDIDSNLLAIEHNKKAIGYFRMDRGDFLIITDSFGGPRISIEVLRAIVNGYDDALNEAKRMLK